LGLPYAGRSFSFSTPPSSCLFLRRKLGRQWIMIVACSRWLFPSCTSFVLAPSSYPPLSVSFLPCFYGGLSLLLTWRDQFRYKLLHGILSSTSALSSQTYLGAVLVSFIPSTLSTFLLGVPIYFCFLGGEIVCLRCPPPPPPPKLVAFSMLVGFWSPFLHVPPFFLSCTLPTPPALRFQSTVKASFSSARVFFFPSIPLCACLFLVGGWAATMPSALAGVPSTSPMTRL